MKLFQIDEKYNVSIDPIAYTLEPFRKLWNRDKSKNKIQAKNELAFTYFTTDYKSDFYNIPDITLREKEVAKHVFKDENWEPDKAVREAQAFYKERQKTFSLVLLDDAIYGISNLSRYLREVSFDDVKVDAKSGKVRPKHDIKKYADTIKQIPAILDSLKALEEAVQKEQETDNKLRGGREKGMYAD